jgi:hypothetical protein
MKISKSKLDDRKSELDDQLDISLMVIKYHLFSIFNNHLKIIFNQINVIRIVIFIKLYLEIKKVLLWFAQFTFL